VALHAASSSSVSSSPPTKNPASQSTDPSSPFHTELAAIVFNAFATSVQLGLSGFMLIFSIRSLSSSVLHCRDSVEVMVFSHFGIIAFSVASWEVHSPIDWMYCLPSTLLHTSFP